MKINEKIKMYHYSALALVFLILLSISKIFLFIYLLKSFI